MPLPAPPQSFSQLSQVARVEFSERSVWGQEQLTYRLPKQPDPLSSPQALGAQGKGRAEAGYGRGSLTPGKSPIKSYPLTTSPAFLLWT